MQKMVFFLRQNKESIKGVLWYNEDLKKATDYVRSNAMVKGTPNMTAIEFCKWVNSLSAKFSDTNYVAPRN